jgi:predicted component of type VI protein secretion system
MSALQNFEDFVERMLEGSISRLFRSPIQPIEIEHRLARVMETHQTVSAGAVYVPNRYRVQLHPADYKIIEPQRALWERNIAEFIVGISQERGYTLVSRPVVTITPNAETPRRAILVNASLNDAMTEDLDPPDEGPLQRTAAMPVVRPGAVQPGAAARVHLRILNGTMAGSDVTLTQPLIALGRELDNDMVIEDSRVSRHHAQLFFQHGRYVLRDLGSTNGTFVNGQPVSSMMLAPGDRISLGGLELVFNAVAP